MPLPKNILVVINDDDDSHHGLHRAVLLAQKHKALLSVVKVIYDQSYDMTTILEPGEREKLKMALTEEHQRQLDELITQNVPGEIGCHSQVIWSNKAYHAICDFAKAEASDLIVKFVKHESAIARLFFTPTDWHLLRESPCNVLFVKTKEWVPGGNILASVAGMEGDGAHRVLDEKILEMACVLADTYDAEAHVLSAYPRPLIDVPIGYSGIDYNAFCDTIKTTHYESTSRLLKNSHFKESHIHMKEGVAEDAINQLSESLNAELLVMGTVARAGIGGSLIGNTAEKILDKVSCDVFAIKTKNQV